MNLIENIKNIIYDKGLKKGAVAKKAGIDNVAFSQILNGKRYLKHEQLLSICEAIGITPDEAFAYKGKAG